jgi:hypothetical protein
MVEMGKLTMRSWVAFCIYALLMVGGLVWATFRVAAPYETFAINFTIGFGAYLGKRLLQKSDRFAGRANSGGDVENGEGGK